MRFTNKVWRPRYRARKGTSDRSYLVLSMNPEGVGRLCSALIHAAQDVTAPELKDTYMELHNFISTAAKYETYNDGRKSVNLEQT